MVYFIAYNFQIFVVKDQSTWCPKAELNEN